MGYRLDIIAIRRDYLAYLPWLLEDSNLAGKSAQETSKSLPKSVALLLLCVGLQRHEGGWQLGAHQMHQADCVACD